MKKIILMGLAIAGVTALFVLDKWQTGRWEAEKAIELESAADLIHTRLENTIASRFSALEGLAALFLLRPETTPGEFAHFASFLLASNPPVKALQYADPDTRVVYVFPPKGNEITISNPMVLISDPKRGPYVKKAVKNRIPTLQGPFELRQGGKGVIVRLPIFDRERFLGLAIGVFDLRTLIEETAEGLNLSQFNLAVADAGGRLFLGKKPDETLGSTEEREISLADTRWVISLNWREGIARPPVLVKLMIWICGGGFLISSLLLLHFAWSQAKTLEILVEERTVELTRANQDLMDEISERKRLESDRKKLNIALQAKNKELEQVVYVASHDLRSPLVNIEGYSKELDYAIEDLHAILEKIVTPETKSSIELIIDEDIPDAQRFIRSSVSKMDGLIKGLLRLSRSGRATLKIEPLDMNALIAEVVEAIEFQIKGSGSQVSVDPLPMCKSDAVQVNQIFSNLVSNAVKYLDPDRPGSIRISGRTEGGTAVYCVEDNGIGIPPDRLEQIFEIFHRLDPYHGQGEGLGLTIVKWILNRLNGTIRVVSTPGSGSQFYISLPLGKETVTAEGKEKQNA
ncbi:MAG: ATP-binding protein [Desulfobacterales bacterium]|nr:ATP-binding protein [Desulfobacterales bacterium]